MVGHPLRVGTPQRDPALEFLGLLGDQALLVLSQRDLRRLQVELRLHPHDLTWLSTISSSRATLSSSDESSRQSSSPFFTTVPFSTIVRMSVPSESVMSSTWQATVASLVACKSPPATIVVSRSARRTSTMSSSLDGTPGVRSSRPFLIGQAAAPITRAAGITSHGHRPVRPGVRVAIDDLLEPRTTRAHEGHNDPELAKDTSPDDDPGQREPAGVALESEPSQPLQV